MDPTVIAALLAAGTALLVSGLSLRAARSQRHHNAKYAFKLRKVEQLEEALNELTQFGDKSDSSGTEAIANALITRREATFHVLERRGHYLAAGTRQGLDQRARELRDSHAYHAGTRTGLQWRGATEHIVPLDNYPAALSSFANAVLAAVREELIAASADLAAPVQTDEH